MDFLDELFKFLWKIDKWENFTISRYWDWERLLIEWLEVSENTQARRQDKWKSKWKTKLWGALGKTLDIIDRNFYYAIPCSCCNNSWKIRYIDNITSNNYTFANLFINNNYQYFKERLRVLMRWVILIANNEWKWKEYPFSVKDFIWVPDDCVNYFEEHWEELIKKVRLFAIANKNKLFFVSAWPLANVIIYEMYKANPNNTYIDVWSALDERVHWRITRWFQRRWDKYAKKYCIF